MLPAITYLRTSTFIRILQTSATAQLGQTPRALLRSLKYIAIVLGPYVGRIIFIFIRADPTSKMCSQETTLAVTLNAKHSHHSTHLNETVCCRWDSPLGIREKDAELQWRKEDHHLHKLHRELYENNEKHAGDVGHGTHLQCTCPIAAEWPATPIRQKRGGRWS